MESRKKHFQEGLRCISPILLGVVPFGLITGISAVNAGFSEFEAVAMSVIVLAGAAQLAAIDLMGQNASVAVIILTALTINLRFLMYSASIAPFFKGMPVTLRALTAYLLTDQAYAVSITAFETRDVRSRFWYYLGATSLMVGTWYTATAAGAFLGAAVPKSWSLDFAVPLTFLALLFPVLKDRPSALAAVCGGTVSIMAYGLPYNLGLFAGAFCGIFAGYILDRRAKNEL